MKFKKTTKQFLYLTILLSANTFFFKFVLRQETKKKTTNVIYDQVDFDETVFIMIIIRHSRKKKF